MNRTETDALLVAAGRGDLDAMRSRSGSACADRNAPARADRGEVVVVVERGCGVQGHTFS